MTNIPSLIAYRSYYFKFKNILEMGLMDMPTCNIALTGIAKDLGIINPVLL